MQSNRSAPAATVVPVVVYEDVAAAVDWLAGAFGFRERLRVPGPGGVVFHAQLLIGGDGAIMMGSAVPVHGRARQCESIRARHCR